MKVVDFGIAKALGAADTGGATMTSAGATAVGVVMGTPAYMSPEQIEGRPVHASSDIFSLGVVLYELATGRGPFRGDSGPALMSSILRDAPPPPSQFRTGLPKPIDDLILGCLDKDSSRRPSAQALSATLRRLPETTRPQASPFTRPRVLVPAALVLVAIVAFFGVERREPRPARRVRGGIAAADRNPGP